MSLIGSLYSAVSGLQTAQKQLQVVSNNIANVNTEGYTRKIAAPESIVLDGQGAGVRLTEIQRTVDENLLRQLREHIARLTGQQVESRYLERTQTLFGSPANNSSLSHTITTLGTALEALAADPENLVNRSNVLDSARMLAEQLNYTSDNIQRLRLDADRQIGESVTRINDLLGEIHEYNQEISRALALGKSAADLEDQRDTLLTRLSEEIDIKYFKRSTGEVAISTSSGRILLDGVPTLLDFTPSASTGAAATYGNGLGGILYGAAGTDITAEITGGRLGGLLGVRDETLVDLQAQVDRLAEVLRDQLNALHNQGTAYPPPSSLTGTRVVAGSDAPPMSGTFRVAVLDSDGVVVETLDIDLGATADINALVAQIDGMANASASIGTDGRVTIAASGGNGIAVNEMDGAVTSGDKTYGMADFLGLNDLFDGGTDYASYTSDRTASDSAALGLTGTLSFSIAGATINVAYGAGDNLNDIASAISGALGGSNVTASVVAEGAGYRLEIVDGDGDNVFITDSGSLTSSLGLRAGSAGLAQQIGLREALLQDPNLLARGTLSGAGSLAAGAIGLSAGDGSTARALADAFTGTHGFAAAGGLNAVDMTLAEYAGRILSLNASKASTAADQVESGTSFRMALENQIAEVSQVDLDEELANIIVLQNAYAASARVTATVSEMLDTLIEMV